MANTTAQVPNPPTTPLQTITLLPTAKLLKDIGTISDLVLMREMRNRQMIVTQLQGEIGAINNELNKRIENAPADPAPAVPSNPTGPTV